MLSRSDAPAFTTAAIDYGVDLPPGIEEARELVEAAKAYIETIKAETPADPHSVTAATVPKVAAAILADDTRARRLEIAEHLAMLAAGKLDQAWQAATLQLTEAFRRPFDDAAARFMGGDAAAAVDLQRLAHLRDLLAGQGTRADMSSIPAERWTRCLVVRDYNAAVNTIPHASAPPTPFSTTPGPSPFTAPWLHDLLDRGCIALEWHTAPEQLQIDVGTRAGAAEAARRIDAAINPAKPTTTPKPAKTTTTKVGAH